MGKVRSSPATNRRVKSSFHCRTRSSALRVCLAPVDRFINSITGFLCGEEGSARSPRLPPRLRLRRPRPRVSVRGSATSPWSTYPPGGGCDTFNARKKRFRMLNICHVLYTGSWHPPSIGK